MIDHSWTDPGAYEVASGVFRIPLPLPSDNLKAVNVYALIDGDHLVLVDAGWALEHSAEQLRQSLSSIGFSFADIKEFLVTHLHRDHYTQAVSLRRIYKSRISLGEHEQPGLEALILAGKVGRTHSSLSQRLTRAGAFSLRDELDYLAVQQPFDPNYELPDTWLETGSDIHFQSRILRVIHTPGHTRGHVVFADSAARVLFAGDHVLPHITPSLGLEPLQFGSPLTDYLNSLSLIRELPDLTLLPAHGPAGGSVHKRVDELLIHHESRLEECATAVANGAHSALDVALVLPWTRHKRALMDLDLFNQALAVCETLAHLEVLVARESLKMDSSHDGTVHFSVGLPIKYNGE